MKQGWFYIGVIAFSMNHAAAAILGVDPCDALYANRGNDSFKSFSCYLPLLKDPANVDSKKLIYQRMFVALSAVINDLPKSSLERPAIDQALQQVDHFEQEFGSTADFYYWKACFVSFDVIEKDRGSLIPTHMFKVLGDLQDMLNKAIKLDPSVHFYGPLRVLGIMHTQMPMIVGGDKTLAEKLLRDAYSKAPGISMNHLAFAKILDVNGKTTEETKVLNFLINTNNDYFNPYPDQPFLSLNPEVIKDKKEALKILNDLSE